MSDNDSEKLRTLVNKYEKDAKEYQKWEELLLRMVMRLCVIASGADPTLDPYLKDLRIVSKKGISARLEDSFESLSDAMLRAEDRAKDPSLFEQLLERMDLPAKNYKKILKMWVEVQSSPNKVDAKMVDSMVQLLGVEQKIESDGPAEEKGFFGRLFNGDTAPAAKSPSLVLAEIIDKYTWPPFINDDMELLLAQLKENGDNWADIIDQISRLVLNALIRVQEDSQATESFLAQLTNRLSAIDSYVASQAAMRKTSMTEGETLEQRVHEEVGGISDDVRNSRDLEDMRGLVLNRLDAIQQHVERHLVDERRRFEEAAERENELSNELAVMEKATFDLQKKISESEMQAMQDALTELPNRRAYDERIQQEIARFKRFGEPLSLLVWDIDNFKNINDTFGHKAGDKTLKVLAKEIKVRLRETDFLARYGGEEFVMLLTSTHQEQALKVADDIRSAVESIGLHSKNQPVQLTVSGGLTEIQAADDAGKLFERADKALYEAKSAGKNRIVTA